MERHLLLCCWRFRELDSEPLLLAEHFLCGLISV
jgi:hypothetical protein